MEAERLQRVQWATVVLDEGQNIKNALTKRSQAGDGPPGRISGWCFRARRWRTIWPSCGTCSGSSTRACWAPWSSFPQALPGAHRAGPDTWRWTVAAHGFPVPAPADQGPGAERTATRTESCSSWSQRGRRGLPGGLRRQSLDALDGGPGQTLQVLAALMRLRRACCNPALVSPSWTFPPASWRPSWNWWMSCGERSPGAGVQPVRGSLGLLRKALDAAA